MGLASGASCARMQTMSRIVYVNGAFVPEQQATISVFDRGFLFADAVYEVTAVIDGGFVDFPAHQRRLRRSLGELDINFDPEASDLLGIHRELVARNGLKEGLVYLQVSRGIADRSFIQPQNATPSLVLFTQTLDLLDNADAHKGIAVMTQPDLRWHRRDIKTTQLLYPSMMKSAAIAAGVQDVWMIENGEITEGSSSNAHIIDANGDLITRPLSHDILHGITRAAVLDYAREQSVTVIERAFTPDEVMNAREAFITSATAFVTPVIAIDGQMIGDGEVGPATRRIRELYIERSRQALVH